MKKTMLMVVGMAALFSLVACASAGSQADGEITGKVWILDSLTSAEPVPNTTITAEFTDDGKVGGSSGCNRYSGEYTLSGSNIEFTQPMASTMMACEQAIMDQESAYFQALSATNSFTIKRGSIDAQRCGRPGAGHLYRPITEPGWDLLAGH